MKTVGFLVSVLGASGFFSIMSIGFVLMAMPAQKPDLVLVIPYPWGQNASEVIELSGLDPTYPIDAPLGSLTVINSVNDLTRLRQNGAWIVLDGKKVAELCSPKV